MGLSEQALAHIEARWRMALSPAEDVPALVAEVRRLRAVEAGAAATARDLRAEVTRLRTALTDVVETAYGMAWRHCGAETGETFCEEYGCSTLLELAAPLRAALGRGAEEAGT